MRWFRLLWLLLLLLPAGGLLAWRALPPAVAIAIAVQGPAVEAIYATGAVEPVHLARVGPAVRARLVAVLAEEGQRVVQGQPLARLDDREARARLEEAEARAGFAEEEAARLRTLVVRDIAARTTADRAESEARAARAAAVAAARRLDDYVVRAPADGVVLRRDAEVGEIVDVPNTLFWIGEPRPLRATVEVDEEDIARVRPGQRALLRADAFAGRPLPAEVSHITPRGDATRKSFRVRLALPDDTPLMIGMTVEANIILRETAEAVLVPAAALRGGAVFVVERETARRREVTVGVQGPERVEIRRGVSAGEAVILDPPARLADGDAVRLRR
ncbi:MAG: efflux RND transporter periplasmic adaptor subunit [Acetobacteraceae bacterium]|nr:efflux RND transporter periplasmic adaptor subunit [Acetobacteraceae bacterium]MCX7685738.1 efflux RND transporter periplasmic adaptor subunit [Acetobacteraceae bacterium]MDW8398049.1 efflux RND transporter periplasmic adaptor subunit [Acetobacteraceae bacterium]